jgi:hypothetical protein
MDPSHKDHSDRCFSGTKAGERVEVPGEWRLIHILYNSKYMMTALGKEYWWNIIYDMSLLGRRRRRRRRRVVKKGERKK